MVLDELQLDLVRLGLIKGDLGGSGWFWEIAGSFGWMALVGCRWF